MDLGDKVKKRIMKAIPAYKEAKEAFDELTECFEPETIDAWLKLEQEAVANGGTQLELLWDLQIERNAGKVSPLTRAFLCD